MTGFLTPLRCVRNDWRFGLQREVRAAASPPLSPLPLYSHSEGSFRPKGGIFCKLRRRHIFNTPYNKHIINLRHW